jgi:hypothetical protein
MMKASVETEYIEYIDLESDLLLSTCLCFKCRASREREWQGGGGEREKFY